jgi:hypothetical protein
MNTGTTCPHERSCHDYKSALVALYVKCISLYGSLRGCEIAESLTEPDYYPEVGFATHPRRTWISVAATESPDQ